MASLDDVRRTECVSLAEEDVEKKREREETNDNYLRSTLLSRRHIEAES